MGGRHDRDQALQGRVSRAALIANHNGIQHLRTDVALHLQYELMRQFLLLADRAMECEGVSLEARDRVAHWVICGQPAPGWDPDPEAELTEAMMAAVAERDAWVRHLEQLPIEIPSMLEE